LEYGMLCLKNALFLLPITERDEITLPSTSSLCEDGVKKSIMGQQQSTSLLGSIIKTILQHENFAQHTLGKLSQFKYETT
ncbi:hypothetical protein ACDT20_13890, partial [Staphylococcus aureus]